MYDGPEGYPPTPRTHTHIHAAAQFTTARLGIVMGPGAQPCITRLVLSQGCGTPSDPLRSELL